MYVEESELNFTGYLENKRSPRHTTQVYCDTSVCDCTYLDQYYIHYMSIFITESGLPAFSCVSVLSRVLNCFCPQHHHFAKAQTHTLPNNFFGKIPD